MDIRATDQPQRTFRVIVADAYEATRDAIGQVLSGDARFQLVGSVGTIEEAIHLIWKMRADVLLLDPWLFGPAGVPGCLAAKELHPGLLIIALLPEERSEYPRAAMDMGADASLAKHRVTRDLIPVLQRALAIRTA